MAKKRPTLDAFLNSQSSVEEKQAEKQTRKPSPKASGAEKKIKSNPLVELSIEKLSEAGSLANTAKPEIVRHMLYLPVPVYDQLQELIFEEQRGQSKRRKTHDYLLDAIDLLFKEKGLKSIAELVKRP